MNSYFHKKRLLAFYSIKVISLVIGLLLRDIIDLASVCYQLSTTSLNKELDKNESASGKADVCVHVPIKKQSSYCSFKAFVPLECVLREQCF